ncbi:hypothetical protein BUY24_10095 [Staphylococcus cohnii]|jgi:hypothetical protein|uniref:hypothetical protein n=1 Tax=Staphylococcus saprophyticus TaxID=29385 RepID=UPI000D198E7E|nr:hypothetical protein [Staphylococcus saprophyticus]PTG40496.1 hypothetical protein BUY24_10095 [Staphylococcus cohnii]MDK1673742.1 hypothetical protein [Staphylococcus saprophyticus]MDW4053773.1 hypothetical protein [Staphylococcus saprophyticus]MDW4146263.1 hypothetical protein [Staphylococcus saprophyticus]PTJ66718.1 hypothetical protein BUZ76_03865 [Staphylococcus saprophyticus]
MNDVDYPILERYMRNYHSMVDNYKNKPSDVDELQYMNLESIVKGITEVYNNSQVKVQQIIKLSWWDDNNHTENVIADVMGISELTLRHAKEVILKRVAKAVDYV